MNSNTSQTTRKLHQLPKEILLQIIEDDDLDRRDVKALALSSSRIFPLAHSRFYKMKDSGIFKTAVMQGEVPILERSLRYDAVPSDLLRTCQSQLPPNIRRVWQHYWNIPELKEWRLSEVLWALTNNYLRDKVSFQKCLDTLIWFHDRIDVFLDARGRPNRSKECQDYVTCECRSDWCRQGVWKPKSYIVMRILMKFLHHSPPAEKVQELIRMIQHLIERGAELPLNRFLNYADYIEVPEDHGRARGYVPIEWEDVRVPENCGPYDGCLLIEGGARKSDNPLAASMLPWCPPSLLEFVLDTYAQQGFRIKSPDKIAEDTQRPTDEWTFERAGEAISTTLMYFLNEVMDVWENSEDPKLATGEHWEEPYKGQMIDVLEEKIEILVRHQVLGKDERVKMEETAQKLRRAYKIVEERRLEGKKWSKTVEKMLRPTDLTFDGQRIDPDDIGSDSDSEDEMSPEAQALYEYYTQLRSADCPKGLRDGDDGYWYPTGKPWNYQEWDPEYGNRRFWAFHDWASEGKNGRPIVRDHEERVKKLKALSLPSSS